MAAPPERDREREREIVCHPLRPAAAAPIDQPAIIQSVSKCVCACLPALLLPMFFLDFLSLSHTLAPALVYDSFGPFTELRILWKPSLFLIRPTAIESRAHLANWLIIRRSERILSRNPANYSHSHQS